MSGTGVKDQISEQKMLLAPLVTQEITRVFRAPCQELGAETYTYFLLFHK